MDTPEIDEGQETEQVSLQDDIASALSAESNEETVAETVETAAEQEVREALEPPSMWSKEYKDVFNEWGQLERGYDYQKAMVELYGQTQAHVTQKEQEAAQFRRQAEEWNSVFQPFQQQLNLQGSSPPAFMRQLLGYYQQLNSNPASTILQLAKNYNLDLATIGQDAPYQSPSEVAQQRRIEQLERAYQMNMVQARDAELDRLNTQIETFASETDASGNPKRPYFEQVKDTMTKLISGGAASGLNDAYDMACKLSPELMAQAEAQRVAQETARKAADAKKAKAASSRPTGTHTGGKASTSLKEDIAAAYKSQAA